VDSLPANTVLQSAVTIGNYIDMLKNYGFWAIAIS